MDAFASTELKLYSGKCVILAYIHECRDGTCDPVYLESLLAAMKESELNAVNICTELAEFAGEYDLEKGTEFSLIQAVIGTRAEAASKRFNSELITGGPLRAYVLRSFKRRGTFRANVAFSFAAVPSSTLADPSFWSPLLQEMVLLAANWPMENSAEGVNQLTRCIDQMSDLDTLLNEPLVPFKVYLSACLSKPDFTICKLLCPKVMTATFAQSAIRSAAACTGRLALDSSLLALLKELFKNEDSFRDYCLPLFPGDAFPLSVLINAGSGSSFIDGSSVSFLISEMNFPRLRPLEDTLEYYTWHRLYLDVCSFDSPHFVTNRLKAKIRPFKVMTRLMVWFPL